MLLDRPDPDLPPRLVLQDRLATAMVAAADRGEVLALLYSDPGPRDTTPLIEPRRIPILVPLETLSDEDAQISLYRVAGPPAETPTDLGAALRPALADLETPSRTGGLALFPNHAGDQSSLLAAARRAARTARRGTVALAGGASRPARAAGTTAPLARSLDAEMLTLHYQPQIEVDSGRVIGLEALARVQVADGTPVALEDGAGDGEGLDRVALWALGRAREDLQSWRAQGLVPPRVSVNLPLAHLVDGGLVERILALVAGSGLPQGSLALELTEAEAPRGLPTIAQQVERLRAAGVGLALDDFGVGYAAPFLLERLTFDLLKLDKTLLTVDALSGEALLRAAVGLGHGHRLPVLAEGVERADQLARLARLGCDRYQGFLFSPPVDRDAVPPLLRIGS